MMAQHSGDDEYNLNSSLLIATIIILSAMLGLGFLIGLSCGFVVWN